MVCGALCTFSPRPGDRERHFALTSGGEPAAFASRLAAALAGPQDTPLVERFAAGLPAPVPRAELLEGLLRGPLQEPPLTSGLHYRYRLERRRGRGGGWQRGRHGGWQVSGWRLYPGGIGWQRRCGPVDLATFVARFDPAGARKLAPGRSAPSV